ncbi:hypothetical protein [Streptomyces sp. XD-27]|nr:hypothetical protein [Streptomyces sp. XD-27]WKX73632.1 hypothetical protein Q3Y56_30410 [Streptomyces sp. XD-27]
MSTPERLIESTQDLLRGAYARIRDDHAVRGLPALFATRTVDRL